MTAVIGSRISAGGAPRKSKRDTSVDLIRAALLVVVVALHSMMAGISVGPDGFVLANSFDGQGWFGPVTWLVQVMPLFFLIGGFSSFTHWNSMQVKGHSASDYVVARLKRLLVPAVALVTVLVVALSLMTLLGVPADLIATAGFRISQPLWFLGVYVLCSALVPLLMRAHAARPVPALAGLAGAAVLVDMLRFTTGLEGLGFLNLLFVWLTLQQLGFWLADGRIERLTAQSRSLIAAAAVGTLLLLTVPGPYSVDMLFNLNPPTICLIVLGVAQLMLFTLLRGRLRVLASRKRVVAVVDAIGQHSMTIYLWHMPVMIMLAAVLLILNLSVQAPLPQPMSLAWWESRPLWLLAVGTTVVPVAAWFGRFETRKSAPIFLRTTPVTRTRVTLSVLLGAGAVLVLLLTGISLLGAVVALGLLVASLGLVRLKTTA